jgi:hypothetical protein
MRIESWISLPKLPTHHQETWWKDFLHFGIWTSLQWLIISQVHQTSSCKILIDHHDDNLAPKTWDSCQILLSFLSNHVCVCVSLSLSPPPPSPTPPILWCSMSGCWGSIMMHVRVVPIVGVKYEKKFMHYFIKLSTY